MFVIFLFCFFFGSSAAAVVMCLSETYNASPFCRTEADYMHEVRICYLCVCVCVYVCVCVCLRMSVCLCASLSLRVCVRAYVRVCLFVGGGGCNRILQVVFSVFFWLFSCNMCWVYRWGRCVKLSRERERECVCVCVGGADV